MYNFELVALEFVLYVVFKVDDESSMECQMMFRRMSSFISRYSKCEIPNQNVPNEIIFSGDYISTSQRFYSFTKWKLNRFKI